MRGLALVSVATLTVGMILACGQAASPPAEPELEATPASVTPPEVAPAEASPRTLPPAPQDDSERPDDCTLEADGLDARFLPDQPGGTKVEVERDASGITESFTMADGTPVRSFYGGCYHVSIVETYMLAEPPADPLAAAKEVLSKVARPKGPDSLVDVVKGATTLADDGSWECGEFITCGIRADGALLEMSFSFAM